MLSSRAATLALTSSTVDMMLLFDISNDEFMRVVVVVYDDNDVQSTPNRKL